ncbi:MAG: tripartite tricarboxylate transporter substrate binding protein [Betaproteobacteria bacterium]|nr:tripartite tricarboxylate transporter substrate binding protein [Betaproteobacteria bacterium]
MKRRTLIASIAAALTLPLAIASTSALAQAWPNKPVKLINPFPAGGGTDVFARPLAAKLTNNLGQSFIVDNLGGAGGTVGAAVAAKAAPDGYTFFIGAIHHSIAETLYTKRGYVLEQDFVPITVLGYVPNVLVINPKHPFKTEAELLKFLKANPGKVNFGSAGSGASHHIAGELYKRTAGVDMVHVPYKGIGPMMQDLVAGVVDMAFDGLASSSPQIKGGKLVPLAVTSTQRSPLVPEVPTMVELGYKDFTMTTWYAIWGIKGTPQPVLDKMHAEVLKVLADPEIKKIWESAGATAGGQSPKEFGTFITAEIAKWGKVIKDSNIKIDN